MRRKPPPGNVRRIASFGGHWRGVTTNKQGRLVQFESEQERKLILLLERDSTVIDFASQPEVLHFTDTAGHQHRYTPDFQVWRVGGQIELHEVTVEARRRSRVSLQQRESAAQTLCQQRGWQYIVHTDQTLPAGIWYANLDFLSAFRPRDHMTPGIHRWWLDHLPSTGPVHPQTVLPRTGSAESSIPTGLLLNGPYHLLWCGQVEMNWHQLLIWHGDFHTMARVWRPGTPPVAHGVEL